jgi:hypothetical protein
MTVDLFSLVSSQAMDCLDFHDLDTLSPQDKKIASQHVRQGLSLLLEEIGYKHHHQPADQKLRSDVSHWTSQHLMPLFPGKEKKGRTHDGDIS